MNIIVKKPIVKPPPKGDPPLPLKPVKHV